MFGYIIPDKPELKIKEFDAFKAAYCGICKSIGKRMGQLPRFTLNYDTTFLAVLLLCIKEQALTTKKERCIAHPLSKRVVIKNNDIIDYAADMNVLLAYYNLRDNWQDDKSTISGAGMLAFRRKFVRLRRKYNEKCGIIEARLSELSTLEKDKCTSVDRAAEPFAKLMEEITAFQSACKDDKDMKILKWIGYNIGKWIYTLDAYDDLARDIKNKSYNPLIYQYEYQDEDVNSFKERLKDRMEFSLTYSLSQIAKSYELLSSKNGLMQGVVENIIYLGMLKKTEQILGIRSCGKIEKSI